MSLALAYVTGILSLLFAASLLEQYLAKRQPYHLLWATAFGLVSMSMVLWFLRETLGLNQWIFRLWYLSGAMLVPAYLGTGMMYLMAPRKLANGIMGYLTVATIAAVVMPLTAHIRTPNDCLVGLSALECLLPGNSLTQVGFFPSWLRLLAAVLNYFGGVAVLAAAVWSVGLLVRAERRRTGGESAQPAEGDAAGSGKRWSEELADGYRNTLLAGKLLWRNRAFWRGDLAVQRAASTIIVTLGLVLGALGLTLNSVEESAPHLGFFLAAVLVVYGGFLASREALESYPHIQLRDSVRALRSLGASGPTSAS